MRLESQLSRMNCQMFSTVARQGMFTRPRWGIEFWAFGRQRDDADILGYDERVGHMPPGLIHDHHSMGARRHGSGDFDKMQVHPLPDRRSHSDLPRGASVLHTGRTSPAPLPSVGQIAPKMWADMVR